MAPITALSEEDNQAYQDIPSTPAAPSFSAETKAPPLSENVQNTLAQAATYGLPGIGAGFVDTVGRSIGIFGDGTVKNALNYVSPDGLGDFYSRNQTGLRAAGEIVGVGLPGMIGLKALNGVRYLREVGTLGSFLKNSSAAEAILGSAVQLTNAEKKIGILATESHADFGLYAGRTFANPTLDAAKRAYYAGRVIETARQTAAFEASYRLLYNSSETFYPADYTLSDQAKWAGAGFLGAAGIDFAIGRYAVRNLIKAAEKNASSYAGSEFASLIAGVISRPGDRGPASAYFARTLTNAESAIDNSGSPVLKTNAKQDLTVVTNELKGQFVEMARDGHALGDLLPATKLDDKQLDLLTAQARKNETTTLFATSLRQLPTDGIDTFYKDIDKAVQKANDNLYVQATALPNKIKDPVKLAAALHDVSLATNKIVDAGQELHLVLENTGDLTTLRTRADNFLDTNSFGDLKRKTFIEPEIVAGEKTSVTHSMLLSPDKELSLDDRFIIDGPTDLSPMQMSTLHAMGSKLISEWKPVKGQVFILNEKVPAFQAEGILTLAKTNPEAAKFVQLDGKYRTLRDAEFGIINQKYQGFLADMEKTERVGPEEPAFFKKNKLDPAEVIAKYNLPIGDGLQPSPLLQVFTQAKMQGAKTLEEVFVKAGLTAQTDHPMDLLQAAMREAVDATDPKQTFATAGNLWVQKDIRPVLITSKSIPMLSNADATIHAMIENRAAQALARLGSIDPNAAPMVRGVVDGIGSTAALPVAKDVMTLHEGVVSGRGIVTAQDRIAEQLPTLKALQLVAQENDRQILQYVGGLFAQKLSAQITKLRGKADYTDLVDFNRVEQSYRHGWEISSIERQPDGSAKFLLNKEAPINRQLLEKHFSADTAAEVLAQKNVYMPDMSQAALKAMRRTPWELRVSGAAADTAQAISDLSRQSGVENNALRVALGKTSIKIRDFHLPTPELSSENAWFVRNSAGNVVGTYSRGTDAANKQRAMEAADKLQGLYKETHTAVSLDDVRREHTFDDNFFGLIDYSDQLAKSGSGITGGLASTEIDSTDTTLKNMVRSLADQYLNVGVRSRAAIFEPQLNYAKQASQVAGKSALGENNIFDRYMATIFSRSTQSPTGVLAKPYGAIENGFDNMLSLLYATHGEVSAQSKEAISASKNLKVLVKKNLSESQFRQYITKAQSWSPLQTTQDWLDSTHPEIGKVTARGLAARLSQVSSTLSLRFLDVGTAVLNLSGVLTNAPPVVQALRQLGNESHDEWVTRTAAWGTKLSSADIITFSPMKAMTRAINSYWSGELNEAMAEAARLGMFDPEYSALAKVLTNPQMGGKGGLERWTDAASKLADNSEILSRKISWAMGYKIGKELHKFDDEKNAYIFANNFLNDMIGNYSPRNKPGMFQGAVGLPLGAFQTYMYNYYRRMYGYVERKDWRTLAAAYATQASIFGASSVPGWSAFNATMFNNYDGSDNLTTRLHRDLSPAMSEMLLHGSMSSIPGIFGRGDLNIAFFPRGSVDWTQVPANPADYTRAPPLQFIGNVAQMAGKTIDNILGPGGFSIQQQEEILANFTTNRALRSIMEFAAGAKTDRVGNVVDASTRDAIHVAAAMLGTVPSSTKAIQDSYNAQQLVERNQENLRAQLNDKTRALMRSGNFDVSDLQALVFSYSKSGGNPAYFGQWLRNTVEASFLPKGDKKLKELAQGGKWSEFINLLAAMQANTDRTGGQDAGKQ